MQHNISIDLEKLIIVFETQKLMFPLYEHEFCLDVIQRSKKILEDEKSTYEPLRDSDLYNFIGDYSDTINYCQEEINLQLKHELVRLSKEVSSLSDKFKEVSRDSVSDHINEYLAPAMQKLDNLILKQAFGVK